MQFIVQFIVHFIVQFIVHFIVLDCYTHCQSLYVFWCWVYCVCVRLDVLRALGVLCVLHSLCEPWRGRVRWSLLDVDMRVPPILVCRVRCLDGCLTFRMYLNPV